MATTLARLSLAVAAATVLLLASAAFAFASATATASAGELRLTPAVQLDPRDQPASPFDVQRVGFGQVDTLLQLELVTHGDWQARTLGRPESGRSLCLRIDGAGARGLLCADTSGGRPVLRYRADAAATLAPPASAMPGGGAWTTIDALVGRPDDATLLASFPPSELGLAAGPLAWSIETRWNGTPDCPSETPCTDRVPDVGAYGARSAVLVQPRCFGAASRDPERPCSNPALRTAVIPTPDEAAITPNSPCTPEAEQGLAHPCSFGRPAADGREHVLLVGDSHASHWRGALEVAAQADGWHGTSITKSGCPFTARPTSQDEARNRRCARWFRAARQWLREHPSVRTVYTSSHVLEDTRERRRDYARSWASLPSTVERIFVIRDTPKVDFAQAPCVTRLLRQRRPAGLTCSQPRRTNLPADPNAAAARSTSQSRVRLLDLSRFFCGRSRCLAVVGGVLVRKDGEHLTSTFSTSLGPYLRRAAQRAG